MKNKRKEEFHILFAIDGKRSFSVDRLFVLLEQIDMTGSISKAAANINASYRYAWGLIHDAEKELGIDLVIKQVGGAEGGGTSITDIGKKLLYQYKLLKTDIDKQLEGLLDPETDHIRQEASQTTQENREQYLLMATTIGPVETGLVDQLEQAYYQETGIMVRHIAAGSGRALEIARMGRVDLALVHAPEMEKAFIEEGYGINRIPLMSNQFFLVGPINDPAGLQYIREEAGVTGLFRQISLTQNEFISRGDRSGTHVRELEIWKEAGIEPDPRWYITSSGMVGNQGILELAIQRKAYTLIDSATYWKADCQRTMSVFAGETKVDPLLENRFSIILFNKKRLTEINDQGALDFSRWLVEGKGQSLIEGYGKSYGGQPFFTTGEAKKHK